MADFNQMVENYFHKILKLRPLWGSDLGLEEYDSLLPKGNRKNIEEISDIFQSFRREAEAFPESELSFEEKIDRECILYSTSLELFRINEIETWRSYPTGPDTIGSALYQLISRDSTPFEKRLKSIISRMEKIPEYLNQTKELIDKPVWIWTEIGIESCHRMKGFIEYIEKISKNMISDSALLSDLNKKSEMVKETFKEYEEWLNKDVIPRAKNEFAIGEEKFDKLLHKRNLGISKSEILELGEDYVKSINQTIRNIASKIDSTASLDDLLKAIRNNHPPDFESVLAECKKVMNEAREFVRDSGFATLPDGDILEVEETPIFMRHFIPFAAYSSPGKYDKPQKGIYMITPVEGDQERLCEFSFEDLINTSVHEGYPGHHLQLVCANTNPSTARLFSHAVEFIEGWAHYCEDAAAEAGFRNSIHGSLIRAKDMRWRAWRIIIDIKLSTGKMTFDEAIKHLVDDVGMEELSALAEVKRYTYTPGYQLSYLLGKHLLKSLKEKTHKLYPGEFSQRKFHDILLYSGNLPINLMEKVIIEKLKNPVLK